METTMYSSTAVTLVRNYTSLEGVLSSTAAAACITLVTSSSHEYILTDTLLLHDTRCAAYLQNNIVGTQNKQCPGGINNSVPG